MTDAGPVAARRRARRSRSPGPRLTARRRPADLAPPTVTPTRGSAPPRSARSSAAAGDALHRCGRGARPIPHLRCAAASPSSRRRCPRTPRSSRAVLDLLDDADVTVVEAAAWALGELGDVAIGSRRGSRAWPVSSATTATRRRAKPRSPRSAPWAIPSAARGPRRLLRPARGAPPRRARARAVRRARGRRRDRRRARRPRLAGSSGSRGPPTRTDRYSGSSIGSTNSSSSRLTCSVHPWPVQ